MARFFVVGFAAIVAVLHSAAAFQISGFSHAIHAARTGLSEHRAVGLRTRQGACGGLMMKGKGIPINMRGEYQKRSQLEQMQRQMSGNDGDGLPVFTIYTRSKVAKLWYGILTFLLDIPWQSRIMSTKMLKQLLY